ncbi:MAG TPA: tetratricopeptide repeat protein [Candidatus Polarisedimenticolia bacterium]|jgi:tetratricopeptide (TPR) repeat protein|nr:tetratricopeptide repeat protein [Candidatus Polarisedimenticolia bacterium]
MNHRIKRITRVLAAAACLSGAVSWWAAPARAESTTKVSGTIVDDKGEPLEKVDVWFENVTIKEKKVGPVKTNKKGRYIHPHLDVGIEPNWRVVPKLPGYMVLKVSYKLVDSQRNDRGSSESILNSKQEFPSIHPVLVGDSGFNTVDFVMVKEADFQNAMRAAVAKKQGGSSSGAAAPPAGAASPAPAAGAAAPGEAAAPPAAPIKNVSDAIALITAGKNEEAIPILKDYLEKNPNNAPVQFALGKAYISTKQYDEAVPALTKTLAIKPDQGGAHFYLGIAHAQMGRDEEAIKEFQAEIPISPDQDSTYSNLASIYEKQGKLDDALENYKKAAEINPKRPEIHASMAAIYEKKGNQALAEAEYKALADVDPANASVTWYNIGAIAKNNDKNPDAVRAFKKAVELDPKYAQAHRELGYALVQQGDFNGAVEHFKKYIELAPSAPDAGQIKSMVQQLSR